MGQTGKGFQLDTLSGKGSTEWFGALSGVHAHTKVVVSSVGDVSIADEYQYSGQLTSLPCVTHQGWARRHKSFEHLSS